MVEVHKGCGPPTILCAGVIISSADMFYTMILNGEENSVAAAAERGLCSSQYAHRFIGFALICIRSRWMGGLPARGN